MMLLFFLVQTNQEITMGERAKPKKRSKEAIAARRQNKRRSQRKALREARNIALTTGTPEENIDPGNAMQFILDRATHMLTQAVLGVEDLSPDEVWVDTMVGRIPNEWIRLEEDLRKEVWGIAGKMITLNIDDRKARAAEIMASILAPVLKGILDDLHLNATQQKRAPDVIEAHLKVLEGGDKEQVRRLKGVAQGEAA
jgi:hypothetical protein